MVNRGIKDFRLMEAMSRIPRHLFVEESFQHQAYGDHALPIGEGQTISQPYVQALMTQTLELKGRERVLEIGTGSGYQTAILAEMAEKVFTIERIKNLAVRAHRLLERLDYRNIVYKIFDGTYGWRDQSPFDAILITAAAPEIPKTLIDQLGDCGRLVAPVGGDDSQQLILLVRNGEHIRRQVLGDCSFVPLLGKFGRPEPSA